MPTQLSATPASNTPLVTFIVVYHNQPAEQLSHLLSTLLDLSLSAADRQIIVVDSCSTVSPLAGLADVIDKLTYLRLPAESLPAALNAALALTRGTNVQFFNAGITIMQPQYEHCLDIVRYHNPDVVLFSKATRDTREVTAEFDGPYDGTFYLAHNNVPADTDCYLFNRRVLADLQFNETLTHGVAEEFTPQLMLRAERIFHTSAKAIYCHTDKAVAADAHQPLKQRAEILDNTISVLLHLKLTASNLPFAEREAMQRRIGQLTMDYIINTVRLTHSFKQMEKRVQLLYAHGLFPLPDKHYTRAYSMFRRMSLTPARRRLLFATLLINQR